MQRLGVAQSAPTKKSELTITDSFNHVRAIVDIAEHLLRKRFELSSTHERPPVPIAPLAKGDKLVYTVDEVTALFGISRGTVYAAIHTKTLPTVRIGRRIFIPGARAEHPASNSPAAKTRHYRNADCSSR
jgi:excisionase family DNA binding protein